MTFRSAIRIIGATPQISGRSPGKNKASDRWGVATTAHQAARPLFQQASMQKMDASVKQTELNSSARSRMGWRAGYLLASFGIYMVDQSSKAWAARTLKFGDDRTIVPGFLDFIYTENRGIAFGQLQESGSFGRWFFVVLAIAAAVAVLFYFLRAPRDDDRVLGACALLLAGIAGNLTDRARLGYVIDFIVLHAGSWHWPTFNVADASISIGALLLAYDLVFERKKTGSVASGS